MKTGENMTENMEENIDIPDSPTIVTKQSIRRQIWEYLEKNNLVNFPRPVYGRIPNFKGCEAAADKIIELDVFKTSQNVKVNPDKPQEPVRFLVLEQGKNLFVPVPRLVSGLLKHVILAENALKDDIRKAVSRRGIDECGKEIGIEDETKIDLIVLGSVAVSKEGYRIGKGKGYADLEFAILTHMTAVNPNTIVITTVHDCQVFDTLSSDLFGPHDVPVDIILTPTQIITVENRLKKPEGIIWGLVSQRRVELMPVLKALREIDEKAGKDVTLKAVDSDVENHSPNRDRGYKRVRRVRYRRPRTYSNVEPSEEGNGGDERSKSEEIVRKPRRRRIVRRRPVKLEENEENLTEPIGSPVSTKRRPRRQIRKNRSMIDFSLVVRNIEKTVRVRDLKAALAERGIKPNIITWRGMKGYCCLHFSKTNPNTISDPNEQSHGVDNVLGLLQNLTIHNEDKKLEIEIMKPISRIETTDVTSV